MKKTTVKFQPGIRTYISLLLFVCTHLSVFAQTPGTALNQLDTSNVRALISNNGNMFRDQVNNQRGFEVPKGSGKHTIFAGALWIGGKDAGGGLHMAAQTYRQSGNDFWPGPIDNAGSAAVSAEWDHVWKVNKSTIEHHVQHWNDAGYIVPAELAGWPANGNPPFAAVMAPFVDLNSNLVYEPALGEYPAIYGDQATYDIFNDAADIHTETGGAPLGVEVHQMSYEINSPSDSFLTNTVFMRYEIGNRSDMDYYQVYIGIWTDFDIGFSFDDYVGTDVERNMYYGYNGDTDDEGSAGYGSNPPVQGVLFLSHSLTHTVSYSNDFTVTGNPSTAADYYNYLKNIWIDGTPVTFGQNGHGGSVPASFMYPGTSDPDNLGTGGATPPSGIWTDSSAGNFPGDRRMLGSIGPLNLPADSFIILDVAFPYARGRVGFTSSLEELQVSADSIKHRYANRTLNFVFTPVTRNIKSVEQTSVNPNPADDYVTINNALNENVTLRIVDMEGREVMHLENVHPGRLTVSVKDLASGIYIFQLLSDKNIYSGKIVKR